MLRVARVELESVSFDTVARLEGRPTAAVGVYLSPGANAVEVANAVTKRLEELRSRFPAGVNYEYIYNTASFVSSMMGKVVSTLLELGMDSLMSVELRKRLESGVGRALPSTLTFNYPNVAALAGYIDAELSASLTQAATSASAGGRPRRRAKP